MFELVYLPAARQDMIDIVQYISEELKNPIAAEHLAEELIRAGDSLPAFPYANPVYLPIRPLQHEYRKLSVQNYLMLYWVDEEKRLVTVACVIYAKRDYSQMLE